MADETENIDQAQPVPEPDNVSEAVTEIFQKEPDFTDADRKSEISDDKEILLDVSEPKVKHQDVFGAKEDEESPEGEKKADETAVHEDDDDKEDDLFVNKSLNIFGNIRSPLGPVVSFSDVDSSAEEEEEEFELYDYFGKITGKVELDIKPVNRSALKDELCVLKDEFISIYRKNNLLQKKMSEYYRKRKLDHVFDESYTDMQEQMNEKYEQRIEELDEIRQKWLREKTALDNEIFDMYNSKKEQNEYLNKLFNGLLAREKEIGAILIDSNSGKRVPEKLYERLIQRQKMKSREIAKVRLNYIKNRDQVKDIEAQLKSLETIDGSLHLMDFEQLRMENTTYADKLEERDEELMRLRDRHSHAHQSLAHTREKLNVIVEEIEDKKEESFRYENNVSDIREYLNELKVKRDNKRILAEKLNMNSGLLTYPRLLMDMEVSIKVEENLREELNRLIATNKETRKQLFAIRSAIEHTEHVLVKRSITNDTSKKKPGPEYYRNRPTLYIPNIPKDMFRIKF